MFIYRPELGIVFSSTNGLITKEGYALLRRVPPSRFVETRKHHSLAVTYAGWPFQVTTGLGLINLVIWELGRHSKITLNSPYLASLSICSDQSGNVPETLRNLVVLSVRNNRLSFFGLRHVRLIRVSEMSCHLGISPGACLEILSMPYATGPMHSTSGPLRLLVNHGRTGFPCICHVRKNRKPVMTIRNLDSPERHEPSVIRLPNANSRVDGYLIEEKETAAIIVPRGIGGPRIGNRIMGFNRHLSWRNVLLPMTKIFSISQW